MLVKHKWVLPFLLLVILLIDGQLSSMMSNALGDDSRINSHLLLLILLGQLREDRSASLYWTYFLLGLIFDIYYVNMIGMASLVLPLLIYCARKVPLMKGNHFFQGLMFFLIMNFTFELSLYALAQIYQLTTYPFIFFVTYNLAPTLLYNILIYVLYQIVLKLCKRITSF